MFQITISAVCYPTINDVVLLAEILANPYCAGGGGSNTPIRYCTTDPRAISKPSPARPLEKL